MVILNYDIGITRSHTFYLEDVQNNVTRNLLNMNTRNL